MTVFVPGIPIARNTFMVRVNFIANRAAAIHIDASVVRINRIADCTPSIRIGVWLHITNLLAAEPTVFPMTVFVPRIPITRNTFVIGVRCAASCAPAIHIGVRLHIL